MHELVHTVRQHPALFTEIYEERFINNIYFDSYDLKSYCDNVDGLSRRIKIRIRWYGDLFGHVKDPHLELKIKNELLGRKETFKVEDFKLDDDFSFQTIYDALEKTEFKGAFAEELEYSLKVLKPTLLNRYKRRYFRSACGNFRITIDSDMCFYDLKPLYNNFLNMVSDKDNLILELKYDQEHSKEAHKITSLFPFRMTKSSKYVSGMEKISFT